MDEIDILFDNRSVVGARLEKLLGERKFTKSGFCKECGISRPTLDKILYGTIGSMTNYEKHMRKILNRLSITPEMLIGDSSKAHSRTRQLRTLLNIKKEEIAAAIEISVDRLDEIEAGEPMTNAELRDIALYLGTSTSCIMSSNVFYPQTTALSDFINEIDDEGAELSGYWGHLGVMPLGSTEYSWYPITRYEASEIEYSLKGKQAVVPCMNNKLLYFNLEKIKSIVLLDDACDPPAYYNWDHSIGEGEIPLVVYEVLVDYYSRERDENINAEYSPKLQSLLDRLIEEKKLLEFRIGELQEENATLKDNNSVLQATIDKLKNETQKSIRDIEKLENNKNSLAKIIQEEKEKNSTLQNAKAKLEELLSCRFDKAWVLYNRYQDVNDYYKRLLVPVFPKDEFESFVGGMFQEKNLERLWDIVKEAQEDNSVEQETLGLFWNIFTYSLYLVNKTKKEALYEILSTKKGEKFDTYKHALTIDSKAQGNLKEVFLPGFQNLYTKKIIRKSIVTI